MPASFAQGLIRSTKKILVGDLVRERASHARGFVEVEAGPSNHFFVTSRFFFLVMRCSSLGSQDLSGSESGDWPRLWAIVVQFCLWQWNGGGSWMGIQGPNTFRAQSVVTGLVCGPLLFYSAFGNGRAKGHGWGFRIPISFGLRVWRRRP